MKKWKKWIIFAAIVIFFGLWTGYGIYSGDVNVNIPVTIGAIVTSTVVLYLYIEA